MRHIFTVSELTLQNELKVLQNIVATQNLQDSPCELLVGQLEEMKCFTKRLTRSIDSLLNSLKETK